MNMRVEHQTVKKKLQEEEIKHKATVERLNKTIRDFSSMGSGKPDSISTSSSLTPQESNSNPADDTHYDDDFDDE